MDSTARLWNAASSERTRILVGHRQSLISVAFSSDGARVVSAAYNDAAVVWAVASGECLCTVRGHEDTLLAAAFSDASVLTASSARGVLLWSTETGECLRSLTPHRSDVGCVTFSCDASYIVLVTINDTSEVLCSRTGACLRSFERVSDVTAVSPDGSLVLFGMENGAAELWSVESGDCIRALPCHGQMLLTAMFSPPPRLADA